MLLDQFTPIFDFALREHLLVDAPPAAAYEALGPHFSGDPHLPPLRVLIWARGRPVPPRLKASIPAFEEILRGGKWVVLGERPGEEVVLGAAGRFWTPYMDWQEITAEEFVTFSRPRRGTIALAFSVRPHGRNRSLLTFEIRATATDRVAHRWAAWYWHTVKPTAHLAALDLLHGVRVAVAGSKP